MDEGALSSYVDQARSALTASPGMSARAADLRLTQPLLATLGWDLRSEEVTPAVEVDDGTLDYALSVKGSPAVVVETVAPADGCSEDDVRRLVRGMRSLGAGRGLLLDGRLFLVVRRTDDGFDHRRCTLDALVDRRELVGLLTRATTVEREAVDPAVFERAADRIASDRDVLLEEVAHRLAAAAGDESDDVDAIVREETASFVDSLVDRLREAGSRDDGPANATGGGHPEGSTPSGPRERSSAAGSDASTTEARSSDPTVRQEATTPTVVDDASAETDERRSDTRSVERATSRTADTAAESETDGSSAAASGTGADESSVGDPSESGDRPEGEERGSRRRDPAPTPGLRDRTPSPDRPSEDDDEEEYVVRFFDGGSTVGAVGSDAPRGAMVQAVEYLDEGHRLIRRLSLPWTPEDADGIAVLNDAPEHPDGTRWNDYAELSCGAYLLTGVEPDGCREILSSLASGAGLRVMFQGDW